MDPGGQLTSLEFLSVLTSRYNVDKVLQSFGQKIEKMLEQKVFGNDDADKSAGGGMHGEQRGKIRPVMRRVATPGASSFLKKKKMRKKKSMKKRRRKRGPAADLQPASLTHHKEEVQRWLIYTEINLQSEPPWRWRLMNAQSQTMRLNPAAAAAAAQGKKRKKKKLVHSVSHFSAAFIRRREKNAREAERRRGRSMREAANVQRRARDPSRSARRARPVALGPSRSARRARPVALGPSP
ncbi:uncharacterized protein LOC144056537 [Vanacampus margaritifer]